MKKNVLITGANRGIGLELCRSFRDAGYTVFAACREPSKDLTELNVEILSGVDVTREDTLNKLAKKIGDGKLDVLVNNAGILTSDSFDSFNAKDVMNQFQVNALGPLLVARALASTIKDGGKLAFVTSLMGSIADASSGYYGYRMSKAALNMAGVCLSNDLSSRKITVILLHPGYVKTQSQCGRIGGGIIPGN